MLEKCRDEYIARIQKVQDYIEKKYWKNMLTEELAAVAGFSKYHFNRIFKSVLQESILQYVNRIRLEHSLFMLAHRADCNMTDIALELGFGDSAIFSRAFKNYFGMSPLAYRKKYSTNCKENLDFANEYLFGPLEISVPGNIEFHDKKGQMEFYESKTTEGWVLGPSGVHTGGWGLVLRPSDMIKIGQLLLNHGKWNGEQIVSKKWIQESTNQKMQWKNFKYGYLWWVIDKDDQSYAALGDGGNVIYINPKQEMVVVIASYFKQKTEDRMKLIKESIEPLWSN